MISLMILRLTWWRGCNWSRIYIPLFIVCYILFSKPIHEIHSKRFCLAVDESMPWWCRIVRNNLTISLHRINRPMIWTYWWSDISQRSKLCTLKLQLIGKILKCSASLLFFIWNDILISLNSPNKHRHNDKWLYFILHLKS